MNSFNISGNLSSREHPGGISMKIKYNGRSSVSLTNGKVYEVISIEKDCYKIIDDTDEDYLFEADDFEIVELAF